MMGSRTKVISTHWFRRVARARERVLQDALDLGGPTYVRNLAAQHGYGPGLGLDWPEWANGVRVEKAGAFCWTVVATEYRGR